MKRSFILKISLLTMTILSLGCNPTNLPVFKQGSDQIRDLGTKETEEAIKTDPELEQLDNVCSKIPFLKSFEIISKSMSTHGPRQLFYSYYSDISFDDSEKRIKEYFSNDGWEFVKYPSFNRTSSF
ncbi:MAG: hypothetical protein KIS76_18565 [Pyrinomonadaceae bacterium]|nr:hypothetical protein [Pyrinomonadaceae bacterium]